MVVFIVTTNHGDEPQRSACGMLLAVLTLLRLITRRHVHFSDIYAKNFAPGSGLQLPVSACIVGSADNSIDPEQAGHDAPCLLRNSHIPWTAALFLSPIFVANL